MTTVKEHILVVEDESDLQELITFNLIKEGYRVDCASSGQEALNKARESQPNLMVLDILLPGIDGLEVCRNLKNNPETSQTPIIMVTAKAEESDITSGLEMGADDYLTKPFSPKVLVARIRALLRRKIAVEMTSHAPIEYRNLMIHPGRHEVIANGAVTNLSFTEFRILLVLAKSPGWVFNRYQIVNEVRGNDSIVTDRSVDVHIASLRKKLGACGSFIETVRGVGYRFSEAMAATI